MKTTPEALSHHERPKHCFHQIVHSKIVKILIYTVNYCYFVCEWDIIYLLYKWSIFVVLFNVSWLQNKHCMHVSYTCVVLILLFSFAPAAQFISSSNSISDTRVAAKHMGCKYQIKLIPFSPFPFEVFLCFVCENQKVQCDFLKSVCLDWIQAWDMFTGLRLFFHEAQNLSEMRNDSQIVWRCMRTHREWGFGVPCVSHWLPCGMRSSMQPAHFRRNSRSPALQLEHCEEKKSKNKTKHRGAFNKLEQLRHLQHWFLNSWKVFLFSFHHCSLWNCLKLGFAEIWIVYLVVSLVQLHGKVILSVLKWNCPVFLTIVWE